MWTFVHMMFWFFKLSHLQLNWVHLIFSKLTVTIVPCLGKHIPFLALFALTKYREFAIEQINVIFLQQHRTFRSLDLLQLQWHNEPMASINTTKCETELWLLKIAIIPVLSKISYFTYLELLNIHKIHPKGPFPINFCFSCSQSPEWIKMQAILAFPMLITTQVLAFSMLVTTLVQI